MTQKSEENMTREEHIKGLYDLKEYLMKNPIELNGYKSLPITLIDYAIEALEQEPKTGHWIPVSERLPEDGRSVLIYAWSVHHVVARYDSFRTEDGYKKCWVTADAWNGNTEIKHEVIAWMPLPELYEPQ